MNITFVPAFKDNYIWLIINDRQEVWAVDVGDATPVIEFLKQSQLILRGILLTHHHWDHCQGVSALLEKFSVPVYGGVTENIATVTSPVRDEETIPLDPNIQFKVLAIPGHTLGHVAYYGNGIIFSGDTLFTAGCGRIFEGTPECMYQSLQKMAALPAETQIYCGHEYTLSNLKFAEVVCPHNVEVKNRLQKTIHSRQQNLPTVPASLQEEKNTNPFLRCHTDEVQKAVSDYTGKILTDPIEVFAALRIWKNNF